MRVTYTSPAVNGSAIIVGVDGVKVILEVLGTVRLGLDKDTADEVGRALCTASEEASYA